MTEPDSREDVIHTIQTTPGDLHFEHFYAGLWNIRLRRFGNANSFVVHQAEKIINKSQRQISLSKPFVHTAKIMGKYDYYERLERDLKFTVFQEGII